TISRGIATVGTTSRLEVVNYLPFDAKGVAPTVTATTTETEVVENTAIPVTAHVTDDVQVSSVELLVDGQVVSTDVSFPFDFFAPARKLGTGSNTMTVQARATDTGGNVGLSSVLTLTVIKDTVPPTVLSMDPPDGASRFEGFDTVRVGFSEALDPAGVNTSTF